MKEDSGDGAMATPLAQKKPPREAILKSLSS